MIINLSIFIFKALQRFVYNPNPNDTGISKTFLFYGKHKVLKNAKAQGYGLHSKEEVYAIAKSDLKVFCNSISFLKLIS